MIEINLLPGAAKRGKSRGPSISFRALAMQARDRVKDPYMLAAIASVVVAAAAIGGLHFTQSRSASSLEEREATAMRDSTRYAAILRERNRALAKRDSALRQLEIIRSIDDDRFVWPHVMDEVSRALPPYTWLKSIAATTTQASPAQPPPKKTKADSAKVAVVPPREPLRFRITGNTVDIQALTRFMRLLETSPFVSNVQLAKSTLVQVDGKEVTEFQLDADYERPDRSVLTTAPVSLSVR